MDKKELIDEIMINLELVNYRFFIWYDYEEILYFGRMIYSYISFLFPSLGLYKYVIIDE